MELSVEYGGIKHRNDEYLEITIRPEEELKEIESSIYDARKAGADILPALYMMEACRSLAEEERIEDYSGAVTALSSLFRNMSFPGRGKLKPVGDYLCFFVD